MGAQHLDGREHAFGVLALDAERLLVMRSDGDVDGVEVATQLAQVTSLGTVVPMRSSMPCETIQLDLAFELGPRKAVGGDAVTHHAAQVLTLLEHDGGVSHEREVVRGGETGRAAADDGDALSGGGVVEGLRGLGGCAVGVEFEHLGRVIHRIALERADVDGIVHYAAPARELAGMLADEAAGKREGVVLADKAHGVVVAAGVDPGRRSRECRRERGTPRGRARHCAGRPCSALAWRGRRSRRGSPSRPEAPWLRPRSPMAQSALR